MVTCSSRGRRVPAGYDGARMKYRIGGAPPADKASVKRDDDALEKLLGSM